MDLLGAARMMTQRASDMLDKIEEVKNTVSFTDEDSQPLVDSQTLLSILKPGDLIEVHDDQQSSSQTNNQNWVMYSDMPGFVFGFDIVENQDSTTERVCRVSLKKLSELAIAAATGPAAGCVFRRNNMTKNKKLKPKSVTDILKEAKTCLDTLVPFGSEKNSEYYVTKWRFEEGGVNNEEVKSGGVGVMGNWLGSRIFGMMK